MDNGFLLNGLDTLCQLKDKHQKTGGKDSKDRHQCVADIIGTQTGGSKRLFLVTTTREKWKIGIQITQQSCCSNQTMEQSMIVEQVRGSTNPY